ncbi:MAG: 50S ribosomal protein L35 [Acidobacteria bacterium]|nr:50S ribosomal protein L35 [Thermoanaerobaculia bacterium]MDI9630270.1 50S ribosomal protein L35 [Acidobacteriota bacterium]OQC37032.1 MAG: 50S ribosomal protein L35 [Acidobacteria bacterium ADurb.Bin051]MBP7812226.1 50S ribosomal protein L35 [Thermoanaerobaculia bacterium]MBP8846244.1 50S ribosomal protein L35 [Thermoanaerobaculia bacterium]
MPKKKTHKGATKRFKLTASGKVLRGRANHSHILTKKTRTRKRRLRQATLVSPADARTIRTLISR